MLRLRQQTSQPWHRPPHGLETNWYHLSGACYDHVALLGRSVERLAAFCSDLTALLTAECRALMAWCVLPNHYHALVQVLGEPRLRKQLGRLHGRSSHAWNVEDDTGGRKCWHACLMKTIRNEDHRWAVLNYVHHNAVHHGYAAQWQDWPFSSATAYVKSVGREFAERTWIEYPVLEMGRGWDDPNL